MRRADNRSGFTLIELTVALSLTGIVLLGARTMLSQLADARDRIAAERDGQARLANGEAMLRALIARAEGGDGAQLIMGTNTESRFDSWCQSPAGWMERCRVELRLSAVGSGLSAVGSELWALGSRLSAIGPSFGPEIVLWRGDGPASFAYLDRESRWSGAWSGSIVAPVAIGIVAGADTMVYPIGAGR